MALQLCDVLAVLAGCRCSTMYCRLAGILRPFFTQSPQSPPEKLAAPVNAEEDPGSVYERVGGKWAESSRVINDWRFIVEFESLSEPRPA